MGSLSSGVAFVVCALVAISIPDLVSPQLDEEKKPTFLTASIGESVVFNCPLDFPHDNPIPYVLKWLKKNHTIFSWYNGVLSADNNYLDRISLLPQRSYLGQGSINLTNIRETDGGWYECKVVFPNRTPNTRPNGTWFHLTVDGGNLLAVPPMNQTVMEGEPGLLSCITKEKEVTVKWLKDGVEISELSELNERSKIEPEGSLSISATNMADLGLFTCEVSNSKGEKQAASAFLNIQYKAKIVYSPREVYFPFGRPALLDCHFRANPPLTKLRWEKDGFLFDPYNVQGVFYRKNGSLYFSKVDEFHAGQYTCTPFNDLGTEGPSPPIRVVVQRPPVFTITPSNLYLRKTGESVEIPCEAFDGDGTHRPTIVWFKKDGTPLPPDRVIISGGNLTLSKIQEGDRGFYQCVASNEAATITSETELIIENTSPRAPYNLTADSTTTSITLRWIPGFVRPNLNYSVWYRSLETPEWRTMRIKGRGITEAIISSLNPGREYELMVLSEDQKGDGMFSKALKVRTKGSPIEKAEIPQEFKSPIDSFQQISAPRYIQIELTGDGYLIRWLPPEFGTESVKSYTVRWFREGDEPVITETKNLFTIMNDFEEDSEYFFQVTAHSTNNYEASSELVSLYIPPYERHRAIIIGAAMSVGFVFVLLLIGFYIRKRFFQSHFKTTH